MKNREIDLTDKVGPRRVGKPTVFIWYDLVFALFKSIIIIIIVYF